MRKMPIMQHLCRLTICLFAALLASCSLVSKKQTSDPSEQYSSERQIMEKEAQKRLSQARQQLETKQFDKAKNTIKIMRRECYLALTAREEGILLMDSIELRVAQNNLMHVDSLLQKGHSEAEQEFQKACQKVQFFERKLTYDKKSIEQKHK